MDNTTLNPLILGITAVAVLASGLLFWNNSSLRGELEALKTVRSAIERDAKAANERANVAERSIEEIKGEMSKVQAANETVNHAVTQLRNQLEQVQIQANTAREDFEKRIKSDADELGKAQADVQRLTDEASRERAAKDDAIKATREAEARFQAELKRVQDEAQASAQALQKREAELATERAAREAAERNARGAANGASTGTPQQAKP